MITTETIINNILEHTLIQIEENLDQYPPHGALEHAFGKENLTTTHTRPRSETPYVTSADIEITPINLHIIATLHQTRPDTPPAKITLTCAYGKDTPRTKPLIHQHDQNTPQVH